MKKLKASRFPLFLALSIGATGCGIYRSGFECPPGQGVGCVSTSEVLDMIVENESDSGDPYDSGKNLFIPDPRSCK